MKISILTATYNRRKLLKNLYESIKNNLCEDICIEWLIMDDGSNDNTKEYIDDIKKEINIDNNLEKKLNIVYYYQKNQGKMTAINNLVDKATGDLIIECDSDDYFSKNAFKVIKEEYEKNKNEINDIYALCFLKFDKNGKNIGNNFTKHKTTMFDLYFKEQENGEKALVFIGKVRKQYKHKLEHNENFVTESRMYHEVDLKYKIICINEPIMICEYQENGYTKNINKQFKENPQGYLEYFKEILERDMKGVRFNKRLYAIKHYILFSYLTGKYSSKCIKSLKNRLLYYILLLPRYNKK